MVCFPLFWFSILSVSSTHSFSLALCVFEYIVCKQIMISHCLYARVPTFHPLWFLFKQLPSSSSPPPHQWLHTYNAVNRTLSVIMICDFSFHYYFILQSQFYFMCTLYRYTHNPNLNGFTSKIFFFKKPKEKQVRSGLQPNYSEFGQRKKK